MDLSDRRRRERFPLKAVERVVGMATKLVPEHADDFLPRDGGRSVKHVGERFAVRLGQDGGLDRQRLREFDVHADVLIDQAR